MAMPARAAESGGSGGATDGGGSGGSGNAAAHGGTDGGPECTQSSECALPSLPVCDVASSKCVECLPTDDSCPFGSYCAGTTCAPGCGDDTDCAGDAGALTCDTTKHTCAGCSGPNECPPGSECDIPSGACVPGCSSAATCPSGFDCCNQQCVNVDTSAADCGACGNICTNANGSTSCVSGACVPVCDPGFGDCNQKPADGCEADTTTTSSCGSCGTACSVANGTPTCTSGSCLIACDPGFADCDKNALANGCEVSLKTDPSNCGICGKVCPVSQPNCSNGACAAACAPGYGDCDSNTTNGCESNLAQSGQNCGTCGNACSASQYCNGGGCAVCGSGKSDCDKDGSNACEATLASDPNNCGTCGKKCGSDGTCGCSASSCSGGTVYFSENFSDNSAGWTLGNEWQIGPTQTSGGHEQGYPDPALDHSTTADNGVGGIVLGGNYTITEHGPNYMTSPTINLSSATGTVKLTFWRWLNCDFDPYVVDTVQVYNGSTWITVFTSAPVGDTITDNSWTRYEYDVTAHKNANFKVRFSHQVGSENGFVAWIMSGWNIDDLSVSSATCN